MPVTKCVLLASENVQLFNPIFFGHIEPIWRLDSLEVEYVDANNFAREITSYILMVQNALLARIQAKIKRFYNSSVLSTNDRSARKRRRYFSYLESSLFPLHEIRLLFLGQHGRRWIDDRIRKVPSRKVLSSPQWVKHFQQFERR